MKFSSILGVALGTLVSYALGYDNGKESSYVYKAKKGPAFDFKSMKDFIIFGDSYTSTSTNYETMVSPGWTSSYGKNWVMYLTDIQEKMKMWNFACGGGVVDTEIVQNYNPAYLPMTTQYDYFLKKMTKGMEFDDWEGDSTLFAIWFGINDIGNKNRWNGISSDEYDDMIIARMFSMVEGMYENGGRNFLFLYVPTIERSPFFTIENSNPYIAPNIVNYNKVLNKYASMFNKAHSDANVFVYDAYSEFMHVEENASDFGILDVKTYCKNLDNWEANQCYRPEQYFWFNSLHPMYVVHDAMATDISEFLIENSGSSAVTTTTITSTTSAVATATATPTQCWSLELGYPCCQGSTVVLTDESGKWGAENGEWCGIIDNGSSATCWSKDLGYACCSTNTCQNVYLVDESGEWGVENGDWCGITSENSKC